MNSLYNVIEKKPNGLDDEQKKNYNKAIKMLQEFQNIDKQYNTNIK
jgi:hypothetical protein